MKLYPRTIGTDKPHWRAMRRYRFLIIRIGQHSFKVKW